MGGDCPQRTPAGVAQHGPEDRPHRESPDAFACDVPTAFRLPPPGCEFDLDTYPIFAPLPDWPASLPPGPRLILTDERIRRSAATSSTGFSRRSGRRLWEHHLQHHPQTPEIAPAAGPRARVHPGLAGDALGGAARRADAGRGGPLDRCTGGLSDQRSSGQPGVDGYPVGHGAGDGLDRRGAARGDRGGGATLAGGAGGAGGPGGRGRGGLVGGLLAAESHDRQRVRDRPGGHGAGGRPGGVAASDRAGPVPACGDEHAQGGLLPAAGRQQPGVVPVRILHERGAVPAVRGPAKSSAERTCSATSPGGGSTTSSSRSSPRRATTGTSSTGGTTAGATGRTRRRACCTAWRGDSAVRSHRARRTGW